MTDVSSKAAYEPEVDQATDPQEARLPIAEMRVRVGVALRRPPAVHEWRQVIVAARDETEAQLIACQISACTSVMPVVSWIDRGKEQA